MVESIQCTIQLNLFVLWVFTSWNMTCFCCASASGALTRMENAVARARSLTEEQLSGDWEDVRGLLLWAAGLRDIRDAAPGEGYTGHCFNDFNHVDATTMTLDVSDNENRGAVQGIAFGNRLGPGIRVASDPDLGPGGTW